MTSMLFILALEVRYTALVCHYEMDYLVCEQVVQEPITVVTTEYRT